MKALIKIVNHGKNGVYLYSAIVLIDGKYFWTKSKFVKTKQERLTIDYLSLPVQNELNDYSMQKYINA